MHIGCYVHLQVKSIQTAFCHAKAYMFKNSNPRGQGYYLTGSSNMTDAGLGLKKTSNVELTIGEAVNGANPDYTEVCSWFEDIWRDAKDKIQDPDDLYEMDIKDIPDEEDDNDNYIF